MHPTSVPDESKSWVEFTGGGARPDASSLGRWLAIDDGRPAGALEATLRSDGRVFLSIHGSDPTAHRALIEAVRRSIVTTLHVVCRPERPPNRPALIDLGFRTMLVEDVFEVDFERALASVSRAWIPSGHSIVSASAVDPDRLFELDNRLRRLVPGTESWVGDRVMFEDELAEAPPFDAGGYLVGRDDVTDELVGLIRFWRNPSGPRLGMIGVLPSHRRTTLGPALLGQGLRAASTWGSDHFVTETARSNRHVHHRLLDLGAEVTGSLEILAG